MQILIKFHDNDFAYAMEHFGRLLIFKYKRAKVKPDKKLIADWFGRAMPLIIEIICRFDSEQSKQDPKGTYFNIKPSQVFIDEEVDTFLKQTKEFGNGEWLYIHADPDSEEYGREDYTSIL